MQEPTSNPSPQAPPQQAAVSGECRSELSAYCGEAGVSWCGLIDERGALVASASPKGFAPRHPEELAAMTADLLRSARALASRLGERDFRGFFQAGERWHYFLDSVTDRIFLLSVFDAGVLPAAVRAAADAWRGRIALAL